MYSINVFVTFSLSNIAMTVFWVRRRRTIRPGRATSPPTSLAAVLCLLILAVTVDREVPRGGLADAGASPPGSIGFCFAVRRHYRLVVDASSATSTRRSPGRARTATLFPRPAGRAAPRAGSEQADRRRARRRLRRAGAPRPADAAAHVPRAFPGRGLRQRRGGRLRHLQGRRRDRGAGGARRARTSSSTNDSRPRWACLRPAPTRSAPRSRSRRSSSAVGLVGWYPKVARRRGADHVRGGHALEPDSSTTRPRW